MTVIFYDSSPEDWGGTNAVSVSEWVLWEIYEPKTDKIIGYYIMWSLSNIMHVIRSRIKRWAGQPACIVKRRAPYMVLVGKPAGKRSFSRHRYRWEDNIKMHLDKIQWGYGMD
jgi:hypothetical protein